MAESGSSAGGMPLFLKIITSANIAGLKKYALNLQMAHNLTRRFGGSTLHLAMQNHRLGTSLQDATGDLKRFGDNSSHVHRQVQKMNKRAMPAFRGEFLSLMFIGMGVKSMFQSMLRPILKMTGLFDVWKSTMIALMAPAMIPLIQFLIKIFSWIMNLDEETRYWIGVLVILGFVLSTIAMIAGMLLLPLTQISVLFGGIGASMTTVATVIGTVLGVMIGIIMVGKGLIMIWQNWGKTAIKVVRGILYVIAGVGVVLGIIFAATWGWIPALIAGAAVLGLWLSKLEPIKDFFVYIWETIKSIGKLISSVFTGNIGAAIEGIKGLIPGLAEGGVVTSPTLAMIGEEGPEAVVPLDRTPGVGGGNTESGGVTINYNPTVNVQGLGDLDRIAAQVNDRLHSDLRRIGIR